jgi:hypothetical protein
MLDRTGGTVTGLVATGGTIERVVTQQGAAPDRTWEARDLLDRQYLFKICVSIPGLTKSLSGTLEKFQHNNLAQNEKHQFVEAPHWQDRPGLALGIVCHRLRW